MATTFIKAYAIMILVFEGAAIIEISTVYPALTIGGGIAALALSIYHIVIKHKTQSADSTASI